MQRLEELGEQIRALFTEAGGSNYMEHHPLSFTSTGENGQRDPDELMVRSVSLFSDIARETFDSEYIFNKIPVHDTIPVITIPVIHPASMSVLEAKHDYYFNQWTFLHQGGDHLPLISFKSYDSRRAEGRDEDKTSLFLRFMYGSLEKKKILFGNFEEAIRIAGIPYQRSYIKRELESLDFDLDFEQATPK